MLKEEPCKEGVKIVTYLTGETTVSNWASTFLNQANSISAILFLHTGVQGYTEKSENKNGKKTSNYVYLCIMFALTSGKSYITY
jgi:hypothetical protein